MPQNFRWDGIILSRNIPFLQIIFCITQVISCNAKTILNRFNIFNKSQINGEVAISIWQNMMEVA
jgi:hypothetical protein